MDKLHFTGMKTNAPIGIGTRIAIFQIAPYRTTDSRQLTPDLMMPPGFQINFQQEVPVGAGNQTIS